MRVRLTGQGIAADVDLFSLEVDGEGVWTYRSRAIEELKGTLDEADEVQFKSLFERVDWDEKKLNGTIRFDDHVKFKLQVDRGDGQVKTFFFSDHLRPNEATWEFKDFIHFLRHNVVGPADPTWFHGLETEPLHPPI